MPFLEKRAILADIVEYDSQGVKNPTTGILACLIQCESGGDPLKINPNDVGSPSYGLLQYKMPTWNKYCVGDIMSGEDQIICAEKMLAQPNGWRHWYNCSKQCMNLK